MIEDPEKAYKESRKRLKYRFGNSAILSADFEKRLTNWPKIGNSDAKGIQEFSDFLQQVEIARDHMPSLKIFDFSSKLQSLVEKLPGWFKTKWSTKVQKLQHTDGQSAFPSFSEFVKEVNFHAERVNIPQISQASLGVLSIQPKIPVISVGTSNGTDHFGLVRPEYSGPALKVVHCDRSGHFGRSDRNVPFHLPKLLSPVPLFSILLTRTSSFQWKVKCCE